MHKEQKHVQLTRTWLSVGHGFTKMTHPRAPTLQISRNTKKNWIPRTLAFSCSEPLMSRFIVLVNAAYLRMRHHLIVHAEMSLSKQKSKNQGIELKGQADAAVILKWAQV